jgi:hypothetical protein
MSAPITTVPPRTTSKSDAAIWATGAANTLREVSRTTENPTTKILAEGLTQLAEATRALDGR